MTGVRPARAAVLVIDDDTDLRDTLRELLEQEGFTTAGAENGAEALDYLRQAPAPGMILLDLSMPVMDGATFRDVQRRDPALAHIPVVVFSAAASVIEKARALEPAEIMKKPVKLADLVACVSKYCA